MLFSHINFKPLHVTIILISKKMERGPGVWAVEPGEKKRLWKELGWLLHDRHHWFIAHL